VIDVEALARAQANGHVEATEPADLALMARTLSELRQRARLLDLLCHALAPLAYAWATLLFVAAAWGVTLAVPTVPRMVTAGLFSITAGIYLLISTRKGQA
jgi:demethoxyubiquinone hydroxylase (CLK1/Coq7/Cat5 family)